MELPNWHFGETARRYKGDGVLQFTNSTDQTVPYTATIETGMNMQISSNAAAKLPHQVSVPEARHSQLRIDEAPIFS